MVVLDLGRMYVRQIPPAVSRRFVIRRTNEDTEIFPSLPEAGWRDDPDASGGECGGASGGLGEKEVPHVWGRVLRDEAASAADADGAGR